MINEQQIYFEALAAHRAHLANVLDDPALRGVKTSVVEKYSDLAHFIYELLQNADDAKATEVQFQLMQDKLVFIHNGKRHFSISNQKTELEDKQKGLLGDLNAITSIANSSKIEASIGKFGVGFKSVFQYTLTPHIYDPSIAFKIHSFIVPERLQHDYPGRERDQTVFVFPFDHPDRPAAVAFEDIAEKLRILDYPILFLPNLLSISFDILGSKGCYKKDITARSVTDNTRQQLVTLTQNNGRTTQVEQLWVFIRKTEDGFSYSVGYFIDQNGQMIPKQHTAFCFFPTKEVTNLNFIIHAPFLLTDSREGIHTSKDHNYRMIQLLAQLAADSLVYLKDIGIAQKKRIIDDNIFTIIPYNSSNFNALTDKRKISFMTFYDAFLEKMKTEHLLPTHKGYTNAQNAYWANIAQVTSLFSNEQLANLTHNSHAKWVFPSLGRREAQTKSLDLARYLDRLTRSYLTDEEIIQLITPHFIEKQSIEWLSNFYQWLTKSEARTQLVLQKPIFLNQHRQAVAALDHNKQVILFLPIDTVGYTTVHTELLQHREALEFLTKLGVKKPTLRDEIYNHILPLYKQHEPLDYKAHFKKFFLYYSQSSRLEGESFIELIRTYPFLNAYTSDSTTHDIANNLYFPTDELKEWFTTKPATAFVNVDFYTALFAPEQKEELLAFLQALGVHTKPALIEKKLILHDLLHLNVQWQQSRRTPSWTEYTLDDLEENMKVVEATADFNLSILIWKELLQISIGIESVTPFKKIIDGQYFYSTRNNRYQATYPSNELFKMQSTKWLFDTNGKLVSPKELTLEQLNEQYERGVTAHTLLKALNIVPAFNADTYSHLTEEEREKIRLSNLLSDIPEDAVKQFAQQYKAQLKNPQQLLKDSQLMTEFRQRTRTRSKKRFVKMTDSYIEGDYDRQPSFNIQRQIEHLKDQGAYEFARIEQLSLLTQQIEATKKYSYGWFKSLLALELYNQENSIQLQSTTIHFAQVTLQSEGVLLLKHPSIDIQQAFEEIVSIPLVLTFTNGQTMQLPIEVVQIQADRIVVKLRNVAQSSLFDMPTIKRATIEMKNPIFLLEMFRDTFHTFAYADDFDMVQNLTGNIEFIVGPPGTGKTTHLVEQEIVPRMTDGTPKILVLAPTNKAADVLTACLMKASPNYEQWLVRFGITQDETVAQSTVFAEKRVNLPAYEKMVMVTTVSRLAYDCIITDANERIALHEINWDYIIIDEASMVSAVDMMYILYKHQPKKFIIAGDPLQIKPVTTVDLWKNENMYSLVQFISFAQPTTVPHDYPVTLLTTQYRSVPAIGSLISQLSYEGLITHHRTSESNLLPLQALGLSPVTVVKFPVSEYEHLYQAKRLQNKSSYQLYSALFTFEYVKQLITTLDTAKRVRIGIISPYKAQADLLEKLMQTAAFPAHTTITTGTIHSFQGDECEIIIALFNPPPVIAPANESFLNQQHIVNVAISRARDCLIVLLPDDATKNVAHLKVLQRLTALAAAQEHTQLCTTQALEENVFGSATYLEEQSESSLHQLINVYGKPTKKYTIRTETNAIDLQIDR